MMHRTAVSLLVFAMGVPVPAYSKCWPPGYLLVDIQPVSCSPATATIEEKLARQKGDPVIGPSMYPGYAERMVRENRGAIVGVRVAKQRIVNDMTRDDPWNPDRVTAEPWRKVDETRTYFSWSKDEDPCHRFPLAKTQLLFVAPRCCDYGPPWPSVTCVLELNSIGDVPLWAKQFVPRGKHAAETSPANPRLERTGARPAGSGQTAVVAGRSTAGR